jgi:diguanylate cyclase (GGDEF)-like protein
MTRTLISTSPRWGRGLGVAAAAALLPGVIVLAFMLAQGGGVTGVQPVAAVRLVFILVPLMMLAVTVAHTGTTSKGMVTAFGTAMVGLALWSAFEAATSLYEPADYSEWSEVALMSITVLGIAAHMVAAFRDGLRRQREAARAGDYDPLTGLLNRAGLHRFYAGLPPGTPLSVVMIDLNNLKQINDAGGHGAGDAHIVSVARALEAALPGGGAAGRWGGDEFVLLLPGSTGDAERLVARLQTPALGGVPTFAAGIACTTAGEPLARALALADGAMYQAKEQQREGTSDFGGRTAGFEAFAEFIETLGAPEAIVQAGFSLARELLGFEMTLYFARRGDHFALTASAGGGVSARYEALCKKPPQAGVGICGESLATGTLLWTNDFPGSAYADPEWLAAGLKSCLMVPVRDQGEVVGLFRMLTFSAWRPITPQMRRAAQAVALRLGHVLERERVVRELRDTLEGGMLGLGVALEARDMETAGHTQRVTDMAVSLGRRLALGDEALAGLRQGAYLHDIGKLEVPDAVLLKPGKLDGDEWAIMKAHSVKGARIAARIPRLSVGALAVIRHHHERWDGLGYPDGLAGTAIPLGARIFAVCDVFDALTSERPYKRAWLPAEALAEIQAQAGRQFDPDVVRAFLELMREAGVDSSGALGLAVA